jgi:hypothetical protein
VRDAQAASRSAAGTEIARQNLQSAAQVFQRRRSEGIAGVRATHV